MQVLLDVQLDIKHFWKSSLGAAVFCIFCYIRQKYPSKVGTSLLYHLTELRQLT